jgi:hypothetical protein
MTMLVGQQVSVLTYTILPVVQCHCPKGGVMQLYARYAEGGWQRSQETCPSCGKLYSVAAVDLDAQGQLKFAIEIAIPAEPSLIATH